MVTVNQITERVFLVLATGPSNISSIGSLRLCSTAAPPRVFLFDTDSLTPLLNNSVVHAAVRLWKQVAGPPLSAPFDAFMPWWWSGRCAMILTPTPAAYTAFQTSFFSETIGTSIMPGSQHVWSRERQEEVFCNRSTCRHGTEYQGGLVVNHAPAGTSFLDGAVNGQVDRSKQLAAYTFLSWLMNDANVIETVINPGSWPNWLPTGLVRPSLLVPSVWTPYGWRDPGLSAFCTTFTTNMEHPNANIGLRLPNALEYLFEMEEILQAYMLELGDFAGLDEEESAVLASRRLSDALEEVTNRWDRTALVAAYQKSLNVYVAETASSTARRGEVFPPWAVHAVAGMLSGSLCLTSCVFLFWLASTLRQQHRLRRKQQEAWKDIVEAADAYSTSLGCPMALVSATDFFDLGCLVEFETLREEGKLRVLDNADKVSSFRQKFLIIALSHQWFGVSSVDPDGVHYQTMCAAVREVTKVAKSTMDRVFLWVDICSIPQEHMATRELFLAAVPLYVQLADFFLVIAPATAHDGRLLDLSTHLRGGWCRAEVLARLVASGTHRFFLCEACDGTLQQVTSETVPALDLNVFLGDFSCCAVNHVGSARCDRERLRTPILGIFAQYLRDSMRDQGAATDRPGTDMLPIGRTERDRKGMFARVFEFVTTDKDLTSSVQLRELFGPLVEMVEQRVRASGARRSAVGEARAEILHEERSAVTQSSALSLAPSSLEADEIVALESIQLVEKEDVFDMDAPCETRSTRGLLISTVPRTGEAEAEAICPGSGASVDKNDTDTVQCDVHDTGIIDVEEFIQNDWFCCGTHLNE